jgi:glucose-6-phosphate isomerase
MRFDPGFGITRQPNELGFVYGEGVTGPAPEFRTLDAIRPSLRDPQCEGPSPVYGIAMDVAREQDLPELRKRMLLFGVVAYAAGRLGEEPVRSQGHVHAISPHSGWSAPEWFEVWEGKAIIYAQESAGDAPGQCIAITAGVGDQVIVPPGWAHCVINASSTEPMVFGALCDREYGFEYAEVRRHHGLAWFPLLGSDDAIRWERNPAYEDSQLTERGARAYPELGCVAGETMYSQFLKAPESVNWVSEPGRLKALWPTFVP